MLPNTRKKAKEMKSRLFFTGNPCKHGHVANRFTSNHNCIECQRINNHNRDYDYRERHPFKSAFNSRKYAARKEGVEFSITFDDFVVPATCPVLGIPLEYGSDNLDSSPSFDRVDSKKGYIPGNVCIISYRANRIKSDGNFEEHLKVANYIKEHVTT